MGHYAIADKHRKGMRFVGIWLIPKGRLGSVVMPWWLAPLLFVVLLVIILVPAIASKRKPPAASTGGCGGDDVLERVVSEYSGDWFVDLRGDNDVLVGTEVQLIRHDPNNYQKAQVIKATLDTWDRLGHPSPERFEAALARVAC